MNAVLHARHEDLGLLRTSLKAGALACAVMAGTTEPFSGHYWVRNMGMRSTGGTGAVRLTGAWSFPMAVIPDGLSSGQVWRAYALSVFPCLDMTGQHRHLVERATSHHVDVALRALRVTAYITRLELPPVSQLRAGVDGDGLLSCNLRLALQHQALDPIAEAVARVLVEYEDAYAAAGSA